MLWATKSISILFVVCCLELFVVIKLGESGNKARLQYTAYRICNNNIVVVPEKLCLLCPNHRVSFSAYGAGTSYYGMLPLHLDNYAFMNTIW